MGGGGHGVGERGVCELCEGVVAGAEVGGRGGASAVGGWLGLCACVRVCVCACVHVRACVCACLVACVHACVPVVRGVRSPVDGAERAGGPVVLGRVGVRACGVCCGARDGDVVFFGGGSGLPVGSRADVKVPGYRFCGACAA